MAQRDDVAARLVERAQRDPEFRARLLADPRTAIAEVLAVELPAELTVRVIEEQPGEAVLVLPTTAASGAFDDTELSAVAGGGTDRSSWCGFTHCSAVCSCPVTLPC